MEAQNLEVYHPPSLRIANSVTVTLTEKNYILWKSQFEVFLNGQGLLGYVTGLSPQPAATLTVTGIDALQQKPQIQLLSNGFKRTRW